VKPNHPTVGPATLGGYEPGAAGRLCSLQSAFYAHEWKFTKDYEAVVARDMGSFLLRYDPERDLFLTAKIGGIIEGGIIIDGGEMPGDMVRLRWFILSDVLRGQGMGRTLIDAAMTFAAAHSYPKIYLTTFDGLDAARRLYEHAGFRLVHEAFGDTWGTPVTEQRFEFTRGSRVPT